MKPLKRKDISKLTSEKLNLPIEMIEDIMIFYYKTVQRNLSSMENPAVSVLNLGTLVIKKRRLLEKIKKYEKFTEDMEEKVSMCTFANKLEKKDQLEKYFKVLEIMKKEDEKKLTIKEKRKL